MYKKHTITLEVIIVFKDLQKLVKIILHQRLRLRDLVGTYCPLTQIEVYSEEDANGMDPAVTARGNIRVTHYLGRTRMDRPPRSIMAAMDAMEENTRNSDGPAVDDAFILIIDGIHKIVPNQDSMNDCVAEPLPYYHSGSSSLTCARFYSVLTFMKSTINDAFQNTPFLRSMKCSTL